MTNGHISLEAWCLGPLSVCADFPLIFWEGKRLIGWPDRTIKLMAALIEYPLVSPDDLAAVLGLNIDVLHSRISEVRNFLRVSRLPLQIDGVAAPESKAVIHYRLVVGTLHEPDETAWLAHRQASDIDRSTSNSVLAPAVRTLPRVRPKIRD